MHINDQLLMTCIEDGAIVVTALFFGWLAYRISLKILGRSHYLLPALMGPILVERIKIPAFWLNIVIALDIARPFLILPDYWLTVLEQILTPLTLAALGWNVVAAIISINDWSKQRFVWAKVQDNLSARRISTQIQVMVKFGISIASLLTLIGIAMTIPQLRTLGVSLFASAGIAGIAVGMAAKPALSNLLAGLQLAFSQPIRLDDVVIVEGEWGRIEEINSTFVVVRIWDLRQMIVPLTYFIEKPFQNWTHTGSNLLGTVFLYLDYTVPVDEIRHELDRILENEPLWDKIVKGVQVTDAKEATMEIRILVSASDSSRQFDLRCLVREKMIDFLQKNFPGALPRKRNYLEGPVAETLSSQEKSSPPRVQR